MSSDQNIRHNKCTEGTTSNNGYSETHSGFFSHALRAFLKDAAQTPIPEDHESRQFNETRGRLDSYAVTCLAAEAGISEPSLCMPQTVQADTLKQILATIQIIITEQHSSKSLRNLPPVNVRNPAKIRKD